MRSGLKRRRTVVHGVHGHPGLTKPLGDPVGQRHMILGHQHPHSPIMRRPA
jgi:hypothetical protein